MHDKIFRKKARTCLLRAVALTAILTCFIGIAAAQEAEHKWTANLGAGFTPLVGALDQRLDNGWNISFGGGYNFNDHFSVGAQVMYNGLGVSRGVLNELAVSYCHARMGVHRGAATELCFSAAFHAIYRGGSRILPPCGGIHAAHSGGGDGI